MSMAIITSPVETEDAMAMLEQVADAFEIQYVYIDFKRAIVSKEYN